MVTTTHAARPPSTSLQILWAVLLSAALSIGLADQALGEDMQEPTTESWLPSLITETPQEGFALAVTLSQKGVGTTQPDASVRQGLRGTYANNPDSLIAASHVIATHFQTVAAANDYWRKNQP